MTSDQNPFHPAPKTPLELDKAFFHICVDRLTSRKKVSAASVGYIAKWLLVLTAFLQAGAARCQDVGIEHLKVVLLPQGSRPEPTDIKKKKAYQKSWQTACAGLGKALTIEKGPWGFGAFRSFGCYRSNTMVGGSESPTKWTLSVIDGKTEVRFRIEYAAASGPVVITETSMPASKFTLNFFRDAEFTDLVAYTLLSNMPMAMAVSKDRLKGTPARFSVRYWNAGQAHVFKYKGVPPPESLVLFKLAWNEPQSLWRVQVVGSAKLVQIIKPVEVTKGKNRVLSGGEVIYEASKEANDALASGWLWAHSPEGPGAHLLAQQQQLKKAQIAIGSAASTGHLNEFLKGDFDLLSSLLATTASGYVGLRYGWQILPTTGELGRLLNRTAFFGLLAEIRGGPLRGLRYYYDKQPKRTATLAGSDGPSVASVEFSRHTIGYSWEFDPGLFVDRITIDPKIGIWNYKSNLPAVYDTEGRVSQMKAFNLGRAASLAIEVGLEERASWYTLRGWYALTSGISLLKSGGRVTSNRFGIDAYFTAGPTIPIFSIPFKTALMGFYFYEKVNLLGSKASDVAASDFDISSINYTAGYAGTGLVISW